MNSVIWKYPLSPLAIIAALDMPCGAKLLTVQAQGESLCLWALVDPDPECPAETRKFEVFGTGHPMPKVRRDYIGTAQMAGRLVWHVFERF